MASLELRRAVARPDADTLVRQIAMLSSSDSWGCGPLQDALYGGPANLLIVAEAGGPLCGCDLHRLRARLTGDQSARSRFTDCCGASRFRGHSGGVDGGQYRRAFHTFGGDENGPSICPLCGNGGPSDAGGLIPGANGSFPPIAAISRMVHRTSCRRRRASPF